MSEKMECDRCFKEADGIWRVGNNYYCEQCMQAMSPVWDKYRTVRDAMLAAEKEMYRDRDVLCKAARAYADSLATFERLDKQHTEALQEVERSKEASHERSGARLRNLPILAL